MADGPVQWCYVVRPRVTSLDGQAGASELASQPALPPHGRPGAGTHLASSRNTTGRPCRSRGRAGALGLGSPNHRQGLTAALAPQSRERKRLRPGECRAVQGPSVGPVVLLRAPETTPWPVLPGPGWGQSDPRAPAGNVSASAPHTETRGPGQATCVPTCKAPGWVSASISDAEFTVKCQVSTVSGVWTAPRSLGRACCTLQIAPWSWGGRLWPLTPPCCR